MVYLVASSLITTAINTGQLSRELRRKITIRILPAVSFLFILGFLDRVNLSFAALDMNRDLKFSPEVYGTGAGIFFLGYLVFEIPGVLLVEKYGARLWLGRMLIGWGIAASLMGAVQSVAGFHCLRILLGVAEAGFFPGIIFYLSSWFPSADRARAIGALAVGLPAASLFGAPLSSWILRHHWLEIPGWRWLFVLEGVPSIISGILVLLYFSDTPATANWLTSAEKDSLTAILAAERHSPRSKQQGSHVAAVFSWQLLLLATVWFLDNIGVYGFNLWLPSILRRISNLSSATVVAISAIPFAGAFIAAAVVSYSSDRTGERRWHTAVPMMIFGVGLALSVVSSQNLWSSLAWLSVGALGLTSGTPGFWVLATTAPAPYQSQRIAIITSAGALGGFCGPYVMGYLREHTNSFGAGLLLLSFVVTVAGGLATLVSSRKNVQSL